MSTWLKLLPLELKEVSDFLEPTEEIKAGEEIVGVVSDELRKLYTLWKTLRKSADLLIVELEYKKVTDEERGKIAELKSKARALELLFWVGVADELRLWDHVGSVPGMRTGWRVVECKLPESPFGFLFGNR